MEIENFDDVTIKNQFHEIDQALLDIGKQLEDMKEKIKELNKVAFLVDKDE